MLAAVATVLAGLIGAGLILMGTSAFWAPRAAAGFGIPATPLDDPAVRSWLKVKAVRDMGFGVFLLIAMAGGPTHLLGWFMLAGAAVAAGDGSIVLRSNGPRATAYGVHFATALVMVVIGVLLLIA